MNDAMDEQKRKSAKREADLQSRLDQVRPAEMLI